MKKIHPLAGVPQSPEHIKKRLNSMIKNGVYERLRGSHHSQEHKRKISESAKRVGSGKWMLGRILSKKTRKKQSISLKKMYQQCNSARLKKRWRNISLAKKGIPHFNQRGENHWKWKGGIELENDRIRKSFEYRLWRETVFARDNFTCQFCGKRGGKLQADHIKPFALYPELRLAIDNGRTLCKSCHRKTDTWGGNSRQFKVGVI